MSNKAKKIAKNKAKLGGGLKFPVEMYNTTIGSIVICGLIFTKEKVDYKEVRKKWREFKKGKDLFKWEDPDLIDHVLEWFGMKRPKYFPIALVQSPYNALFCPYDKKLKMVLPLREDGFTGPTLRYGKVYPVEFGKVVKNRIWLKEKIKAMFFRKKKEDAALQG